VEVEDGGRGGRRRVHRRPHGRLRRGEAADGHRGPTVQKADQDLAQSLNLSGSQVLTRTTRGGVREEDLSAPPTVLIEWPSFFSYWLVYL
jgi:hypothetical protein